MLHTKQHNQLKRGGVEFYKESIHVINMFYAFGGRKLFALMVDTHHSCMRLIFKEIYLVGFLVSVEIMIHTVEELISLAEQETASTLSV